MVERKLVRAAVIGAGNIGRHHVRAYAQLPGVELVAVADINPGRRLAADRHGVPFYRDFREMLARHAVDAVSIAVPAPVRFPIAAYALQAGVHTLVEKPIAETPHEADRLIESAARHGVVFTAGHVERYNPVVTRLGELIRGGDIGQVLSVVCKRVGGFPAIEPQTDVIVDLAVHDIDIISALLGQAPRVIGSHVSRTFHPDKADSAEILLGFEGASGFIQANWITPVKIRTIAVTGSRGYVEANYITQEIRVYEHSSPHTGAGFEGFVAKLGEPRSRVEMIEKSEPLVNELEAFARAVSTGDAGGVMSPEEAKRALEVALEATRELTPAF